MREGWVYKKLGELVNVKTGKLDANAASEDGEYPFFTCSKETLRISNYSYDCECVLVAGNGDLNVKYYKGKFDAYQRTYIITLKDNVSQTFVPYIYKFFNSYIEELRNKSIGGIIKYIKLGDITNALIPLPPLSLQHSIVSELDEINNLLSLKRKELETYDKLAQSLFYEMFGDPVENEKGWEVKKLDEIAEATIGLTYKPENVSDEGVIVLRSGNIQDFNLAFDDIVRVNAKIPQNKFVRNGDILMCTRNGSFRLVGKVAMIQDLQEEMSYGAFMTIIRSKMNPYLLGYFKTSAFRERLIQGKTTTVNQITVKMLNEIKLPIPPLPLQQLFAQRIEAIEQQKTQVKVAIEKLETLLAARMQYYFD